MALSTIGTAAIADDAITTAKIDDDAITDAKIGDNINGKITLDGSSVATVTVNSAVSSSATIVVDGVSGTIAVGMVVNVSDTTVRSISDASSETAVSEDDTLTITAVASQTSFTVSEAVSIADNVVLILRADENSKMVLDASAASTDVGEEILFEDGTSDGSIATNSVVSAAFSLIDVTGSLSNAMTMKRDGGGATTNIAQGLCKAWVGGLSGNVINSVVDTFNISSIADDATGDFTTTLISNMGNAFYNESAVGRTYHINSHPDDVKATTGNKHETFYVSGVGGQREPYDLSRADVQYTGDLA